MLYLYLFFHLLNQQSNPLNSLIPKVFSNSKAFSLSMIPSVGMFWLFFLQTSGKLLYLFGRRRRSFLFENLNLFFTHVERVFFGTPYFAAASLFVIPFCKSFKALPFTPIGLLFNRRFMNTLFFFSQRTKIGLFEFTRLCLCFEN